MCVVSAAFYLILFHITLLTPVMWFFVIKVKENTDLIYYTTYIHRAHREVLCWQSQFGNMLEGPIIL